MWWLLSVVVVDNMSIGDGQEVVKPFDKSQPYPRDSPEGVIMDFHGDRLVASSAVKSVIAQS